MRWIYCAYNEIANTLRKLKRTEKLNSKTVEKLVVYSTKVLCDFKLYLLQISEKNSIDTPNLNRCIFKKCTNQNSAVIRTFMALREARDLVLKITENVRPVLEDDNTGQTTSTAGTTNTIQTKNQQVLNVNPTNSPPRRQSNKHTKGRKRHRRRCKNRRNRKARRKCRRRLNKRRRRKNRRRINKNKRRQNQRF